MEDEAFLMEALTGYAPQQPTTNDILSMMEVDIENRKPGSADLYQFPLETVPWDFSKPTILAPSASIKFLNDERAAIAKLYDICSGLKSVDWTNMFLAGGAATAAVTGSSFSDIDVFLYGIKDHKEATKKAIRFIKKVVGETNQTIVTTHCVTAQNSRMRIQVILRLYDTPGQVLHGFDLPCCAIGFDGTHFYFTGLAAFAVTTGFMPLDTRRRSTTFDTRISKYWKRGFGLILPYFDVKKVSRPEVTLKDLAFEIRQIDGFKITVDGVTRHETSYDERNMCDYAPELFHEFGEMIQNMRLAYINAKAIATAKLVDGKYMLDPSMNLGWASTEDLEDLKTPLEAIESNLYQVYDFICVTYKEHMDKRKTGPERMTKFPFAYITLPNVTEIYDAMHGDYVSYIYQIFSKQKQIAKQIVHSYPDKLNWMEIGVDSQTYGSIHPIIEDASKWYLSYYSPCPEKPSGKVELSEPRKKGHEVYPALGEDEKYEGEPVPDLVVAESKKAVEKKIESKKSEPKAEGKPKPTEEKPKPAEKNKAIDPKTPATPFKKPRPL